MSGSGALPFDPIEEAHRQWVDHGWDEAADGMAALTSIIRVEQILMARVDAQLKPLGLTFARYELLVLLDFSRNGSLPLGKIGARLQVHPASVTNAVDRLEADGLVERIAHPGDRRTTLATITAGGRRTARRATRTLNEQVFSDLGWSRRDLDALFRILRRLRKASGDFA
ncbi:MarR family winged helix-turn-helix transcriptional regulator [Dermatobacter hominis]|uniref:MarR family winged helix-turn-helix transcriptional regulator n=1 Tax=Dermatobacter hominis TaxID=2884263 RepID=UPI001D0F6D9D|nr:MarR family transcriptional regulator [Dermatobacter hominis]UDY35075.1 MarR family transcriptional regulator [Dermatobacter hominis]